MPIAAEFEEKEFENYFNRHLSVIDNQSWSPGQVLEGQIGFDGAYFAVSEIFYHLGWTRRRWQEHRARGVALDTRWVEKIFDVADGCMPREYRFNFFAQHKRPTYVFGHNGGQMETWGNPYYRFEVDEKQNNILCKLEGICGPSAVVSYCCPAFHTKNDLWLANRLGAIIQKTNYAPPSRLKGHHTYTFQNPGGIGYGHSTEEEINGKPFEELMRVATEHSEPQSASALTVKAGQAIKECFEDMGDDADLAKGIVSSLMADQPRESERAYSLTKALAHIYALKFAFGTSVVLMRGIDER